MHKGNLLYTQEISVDEICDKIKDTLLLSINLSHDK